MLSMMSEQFSRKCNVELHTMNENKMWKTASGDILNVIGVAYTYVHLENIMLKTKFYVAENLSQSLIIGMDIIKSNGMELNFKEDVLKIQGKTVRLQSSNNVQQVNQIITVKKWRPSKEVVLDTANLTKVQLSKISELVDKYCDVFSTNEFDIGKAIFKHEIKLISAEPIKSRAYRVPYVQKKLIEEHMDKMLKMGVIEKSIRVQ